LGLAGSKVLPSKNFSTPREVDLGISASFTPTRLGGVAPDFLAIDRFHQP
jgi:hypothetical protein